MGAGPLVRAERALAVAELVPVGAEPLVKAELAPVEG